MVVYLITNSNSGKRYVGKTTKLLDVRWRGHVATSLSSDVPLARAIKKHGTDAFTREVLEACDSLDMLNEREIFWIQKLDTYHGRGYNATPGGDGNGARFGPENHNFGKAWGKLDWSTEERAAMSAARMGRNNPMFGRTHSIEIRKRISESGRDRAGVCRKVKQFTRDGNFVAEYVSIVRAAEAIEGRCAGIRRVLSGERPYYYNFSWQYA